MPQTKKTKPPNSIAPPTRSAPQPAYLVRRARELGLDRRDNNACLVKWAAEGLADESDLLMLKERIEEEEQILSLTSDPFRATTPWAAESLAGDTPIGHVVQTGHPYGLDLRTLSHHVLAMGRTQGGKTTFLRKLIAETKTRFPHIRFFILESKREFTDVAKEFGFHVIRTRDLRINVLRPPNGIPHHVWLSLTTQLMVNYLDIRVASSGMILDMAMKLLRERGVFTDRQGPYPNLRDLCNSIAAQKYPAMSHYARYQETTTNRLRELLNAFPKVFECEEGLDQSRVADMDLLILVEDMPDLTMVNFLKSLLSSAYFLYHLIVVGAQDSLKKVMVLDEASTLFRRADEIRDKPSYVSTVVSQAAGFGISILSASQFSTDLSHALMANTGTKVVVGGFERGDDYDAFLRTRPCSREQANFAKEKHTSGHAFLSDPRHTHFFECLIDQPDISPPMSMAEIDERSRICAQEFGWDREAPGQANHSRHVDGTHGSRDNNEPFEPDSSGQEQQVLDELLIDLEQRPFQRLRDRAAALKMPPTTMKELFDKLENRGLLKRYPVHSGKSRPRDLFELTEEGYHQIGKPKPRQKGRGGYLHQFYQKHVADFFKKSGYTVDIEGLLGNKNADLVVTKLPDGETFAVEIELHIDSSEHYLDNLRKDFKSPRVSNVICLLPTAAEAKAARRTITGTADLQEFLPRIEIKCLRDYMDVD